MRASAGESAAREGGDQQCAFFSWGMLLMIHSQQCLSTDQCRRTQLCEAQAAVSTMPVVLGSGTGASSSGLSDQCGMENRSNKILLVWKLNENAINITVLTDITWDTQKKAQGHCE